MMLVGGARIGEESGTEWSGWLRVNNNSAARIHGIVDEDSEETLDINPGRQKQKCFYFVE